MLAVIIAVQTQIELVASVGIHHRRDEYHSLKKIFSHLLRRAPSNASLPLKVTWVEFW